MRATARRCGLVVMCPPSVRMFALLRQAISALSDCARTPAALRPALPAWFEKVQSCLVCLGGHRMRQDATSSHFDSIAACFLIATPRICVCLLAHARICCVPSTPVATRPSGVGPHPPLVRRRLLWPRQTQRRARRALPMVRHALLPNLSPPHFAPRSPVDPHMVTARMCIPAFGSASWQRR